MLKLEAKYLLLPNPKYFKLTSKMKRGYLSTLKYIIKCLSFMFSVINFKIYWNGCTVCWHLVWENSEIVDFVFTITIQNITISTPDCRNIFVKPPRRMRGAAAAQDGRRLCLPILFERVHISQYPADPASLLEWYCRIRTIRWIRTPWAGPSSVFGPNDGLINGFSGVAHCYVFFAVFGRFRPEFDIFQENKMARH